MSVSDARLHDRDRGGTVPISAAIVDTAGDQPRIGSITLPPRAPDSTLLTVLAAPLNPLDLLIASGAFHSVRHDAPYVPGSECVGRVLESDRFAVGAMVYAECQASPVTPGSFATSVVVKDSDVLVLPEGVDPVLAAAVGNSGVAAYLPLVEVAVLKTDEIVLILGATGAVGQLAVQIAHAKGAAGIIGVGRDRHALDSLTALGVDKVLQLRANESADDLAARLSEVASGANVVLDGLYGAPLEAALQVCAPRARLVNIGHSAGATATIPAGLLRGKQLTLSGFAGLHTPLSQKQPALAWLWSALVDGTLQVNATTVTLEQLPTAWLGQAASPHTKYVVVPTQTQQKVTEK